MTKTSVIVPGGLLLAGIALWTVSTRSALSARSASTGPPAPATLNYTSAGELVRPTDFREWVFLSSGLGMTYSPPASGGASTGAAARPPSFTNVYVNPSSYRKFTQTGAWPDQTMFILEIRASASEGSINLGGRYQTELRAVEAEVNDSRRYPDKWAYFDFGPAGEHAAPLPKTAPCYACHGTKAAVEQTFVQFYPTLMEVARKMGTVNRTYDPGASPHH
jgi:hypothetical protein